MKTAIKKLEVNDIEKLHALVIENAEGLEPGLTVLDYRLLLGHATIDAVARDAAGSLVLIAIGVTADEEMLLKAVEAYSWCLEYPEGIRRLYHDVQLSEARPPRLVFVIERMPDAFHRKVKQLGFPEVDCVEFRLLSVDGTPAIFFDRIARLRRVAVSEVVSRVEAPSPAPAAPPTDKVISLGTAQRAGSARLQKLLTQAGAESTPARPVPPRDAAPVVSMIHRASAAPALSPALESEGADPVLALAQPEPPVVSPSPAAEIADVSGEPDPIAGATVEATPFDGASDRAESTAAEAPAAIEVGAEPTPEPIAFRETLQADTPATPEVLEPKRVSFAEAAAKALLQQTRPAAPGQADEARPDTGDGRPAPAVPPGFEGLQFPGDGQLTRQWMEFLNQMAAAKK